MKVPNWLVWILVIVVALFVLRIVDFDDHGKFQTNLPWDDLDTVVVSGPPAVSSAGPNGLSCSIAGHTLVTINGQPICKGPTKTECNAKELEAQIPAGAFNKVWKQANCSWQYELANN